jgi:hypothetical protein
MDEELISLLHSVSESMESGLVQVSISAELITQCADELTHQRVIQEDLNETISEIRSLVLMLDKIIYQNEIGIPTDKGLADSIWGRIKELVRL